LKVSNPVLDFETLNTYAITVSVTDDGGDVPGPARLSDTAQITIRIRDVNEPPTLEDTVRTVREDATVGMSAGTPLQGSDVDAGSVLT